MSFYVSTANFFLLHCDEWDRVVALPRHKFVTGATLLQLIFPHTFVFHENTFFINSSDEVTSLSWKVGNVRYNKNISVLVTKTLFSCLCSSTFTL